MTELIYHIYIFEIIDWVATRPYQFYAVASRVPLLKFLEITTDQQGV